MIKLPCNCNESLETGTCNCCPQTIVQGCQSWELWGMQVGCDIPRILCQDSEVKVVPDCNGCDKLVLDWCSVFGKNKFRSNDNSLLVKSMLDSNSSNDCYLNLETNESFYINGYEVFCKSKDGRARRTTTFEGVGVDIRLEPVNDSCNDCGSCHKVVFDVESAAVAKFLEVGCTTDQNSDLTKLQNSNGSIKLKYDCNHFCNTTEKSSNTLPYDDTHLITLCRTPIYTIDNQPPETNGNVKLGDELLYENQTLKYTKERYFGLVGEDCQTLISNDDAIRNKNGETFFYLDGCFFNKTFEQVCNNDGVNDNKVTYSLVNTPVMTIGGVRPFQSCGDNYGAFGVQDPVFIDETGEIPSIGVKFDDDTIGLNENGELEVKCSPQDTLNQGGCLNVSSFCESQNLFATLARWGKIPVSGVINGRPINYGGQGISFHDGMPIWSEDPAGYGSLSPMTVLVRQIQMPSVTVPVNPPTGYKWYLSFKPCKVNFVPAMSGDNLQDFGVYSLPAGKDAMRSPGAVFQFKTRLYGGLSGSRPIGTDDQESAMTIISGDIAEPGTNQIVVRGDLENNGIWKLENSYQVAGASVPIFFVLLYNVNANFIGDYSVYRIDELKYEGTLELMPDC